MVRLIARAAAASALAAALAVPLTLGTSADTLPSAPSAPSLPAPLTNLVPAPLAPAQPAPSTSTSTSSSTNSSASDPSSTATANALDLSPIVCVSCTGGTSSTPPPSSSSTADALNLFGTTVEGGTAGTGQTKQGDLIALPANPLLSLALADWIAHASNTPSTFERASLLDLNLNRDGSRNQDAALTQLVTLAVLEAKSSTNASCEAGGASGESNGARLNLGNSGATDSALAIILLHAGASTNSPGSVYLASINGNEIGSAGQTGGNPIHITIPGLTTITLISQPGSGCGNTPPPGCTGAACNNNPPGVCPPGVVSIELPPGTCLGSGINANQTSTSANTGNPGTGVQGATTGSTGGTGVPSTGIALGILGFLLLGGGLFAMAASRFARRWRSLT